jgi:hypothetical protein
MAFNSVSKFILEISGAFTRRARYETCGSESQKIELRETTVKQAGSAGKTAYRHWILEKRMHFQPVHS